MNVASGLAHLTVPFAVGQLLASPRSAGLVQRYGAKATGATGLLVMAAALAGYATLGTATPIWVLGVLFAIQGAAIGVATVVLLQRDFDLASRAFDAARGRTRDKNEQKFLSYAIGDLATIKVR